MIRLIFIISFMCISSADGYLKSVLLKAPKLSEYYSETQIITDFSSEVIDYNVELGDFISTKDLFVETVNEQIELRISYSYETSITIMAEGPHIDLLDWKHHNSKWEFIPINKEGYYSIPDISEKQSSMFPQTSMEELRNYIKNKYPNWFSHIKDAKQLTEYPIAIGLNKIILRFEVKENAKWKQVQQINFHIPMGC